MKNQKSNSRNLKEELDSLREQLHENKINVSKLKKELENANSEIKTLKGIKDSEEKGLGGKCDSCDFASESKTILRKHSLQNHPRQIKCKFCDKNFERKSDLESHINLSHGSVKKFQCEHCDKTFVLEWRLNKHKRIHKGKNIIKCHYFNNKKDCPFEEIGCMFMHSYSKMCKYGKECNKMMCSLQHSSIEETEKWNCGECKFFAKTEKELVNHLDDVHEYWKWNEQFCDTFCRGDLGMHICMSDVDFNEYIGFDVKNTFSTEETDYNYKCLKCEKSDEDDDNMRQHIQDNHKFNIVTKCKLCVYEDKSFTGMKTHYRTKHMKT